MKRLTVEELPRLRHIGKTFADAAKLSGGFCESHFEEFWRRLLYEDLGVIFYENAEDGSIAGVLGAIFSEGMFSGWKIAAESFLFVVPEFRGKSLSIRLLKAFEAEAAVRGCRKILMTNLVACEPELVGAFLTRHGYSATEVIHEKEIN